MSCLILFPNQLFDVTYIMKIINKSKKTHIILWEYKYFFKKYKYHKMKLAFHRATMKNYFDNITIKKIYIESIETEKKQTDKIKKFISDNNIEELLFFNPIEKELLNLLQQKKLINSLNIDYILFPSPYFLNSTNFNKNNEIQNKLTSIRHDNFYKNQRITYDIMIKNNNDKITPDGGSWSFDKENRKPYEKTQKEIELLNFNNKNNKYIIEAINYIETNYPNNYGSCIIDNFIYPISKKDCFNWLDDFIDRKLNNFGKYEDALSSKIKFGYHSLLSSILNIGLIVPYDVLEKVKNYKKNIASKEGFIRQIFGWREYCYFIYDKHYSILTTNFFYTKSKNKIPEKFWLSNTQIPIIDNILVNINNYAYSHHIERLMCIGNFLLLLHIEPLEIFNWFQTMYIDSYDVFMVPNVYGMLLYGFISDNSHMMTRPYFCSSNYLIKMSDYKTSDIVINNNTYKWNVIFDALYYNFINTYSDKFSKLYSSSNAVKIYNNFSEERKKEIKKLSNIYFNYIFN